MNSNDKLEGMGEDMVWITLGAIIIAVICLIRYELYRNQIKQFRDSIKFIGQHNSNMRISQEISNKEIADLVSDLNHLMQKHRQMEQEVEKKEQALKDLVTNLSHDIRTPLTSLDGYFQLLMTCNDVKERDRYYQIINGRIESLRVLLEQLFMYMKLQNNAYEFERKNLNLNKLLYDGMLEFYQEFTNREIEPLIEVEEEPIIINANDLALKRVIQNIIKNVLEHGNDKFILRTISKNNKVSIQFENEFSKNSPIDMDKIFERFYKADQARTSTSTGLGLAIAQELVVKMNGEIKARSDGSKFTIELQFDTMN